MSSFGKFILGSYVLLAVAIGCETGGGGSNPPPPPPEPPVADFSASTNQGIAPLEVVFDASAAKGDITIYSWSFGDGQTGDGKSVEHIYTEPGDYVVRLTVIGPENDQDNAERKVAVLLDITSIQATPAEIMFSAAGQTQRLTVEGTLISGTNIDLSQQVVYTSSNPDVATVAADGLVTAKAPGFATISIQYGDLAADPVSVTAAILEATALRVSPTKINFGFPGQTQALTCTVDLADGGTADVTAATAGTRYTSTDPSVAAVDANGLVTAIGGGNAVISIKYGTLPPATVSVAALDVASIAVAPTDILFTGTGQTKKLTVTATLSDGTTSSLTGSELGVAYSSNDETVATVSSNGVVTAVAPGTATVSVVFGNLAPANVSVEVLDITDVEVTPSPVTLNLNQTQQLTVTANLQGGLTKDLTKAETGTKYTSTNPTVATVSADGLVTAKAIGSANISVQVGSRTPVTLPVTVELLELTAIDVTPKEVTFTDIDQTQQLKVMGTPKDGGPNVDVTSSCLYASDKTSVAIVSAVGLVTAKGAGSATISVTYGQLTPKTVPVSVLTGGTGAIIDLGLIGTSLTGLVFQGFNEGARTGSEIVRAGDFNVDGINDGMLIAQYGSGFGRLNVGEAWMIYGLANRRFTGIRNVNEIGTQIPGTILVGPEPFGDSGTQGIVSAAVIRDITGDGKPDLLIGMPFVSGILDAIDIDPQDKKEAGEDCSPGDPAAPLDYRDGLPNRISDEGGADGLGAYDFYNDVPLDGGYVFFLSQKVDGSAPQFEGAAIDIDLIGQGSEDAGQFFDAVPRGTRWRGSWFDLVYDFQSPGQPASLLTPDTQFGATVASIPDMTSLFLGTSRFKDGFDEILISVPNGVRITSQAWYGADRNDRPGRIIFQDGFPGEDGNRDRFEDSGGISSVPTVSKAGDCWRATDYTWYFSIVGEENGDEFGWAADGGDFNMDGSNDILCGAPGADRNGKTDSGILYVLFGSLTIGEPWGTLELATENPPRIEIHGEDGDRMGRIQALVDDFDGELIRNAPVDDIAFGLPLHDSDGVADSGMVGVVFGGQFITGEKVFQLNQVATDELPGLIIKGETENQQFGASVASAGDFNNDGLGDLVITAPGEVREMNGQQRRGVVYVVFGSPDYTNRTFVSSDIGTAKLPGRVLISPYTVGTLDEAAPLTAKGIGDLDADGYDDIMIGNPDADYVYRDSTGGYQRRPDAGEAYLIYGNSL